MLTTPLDEFLGVYFSKLGHFWGVLTVLVPQGLWKCDMPFQQNPMPNTTPAMCPNSSLCPHIRYFPCENEKY